MTQHGNTELMQSLGRCVFTLISKGLLSLLFLEISISNNRNNNSYDIATVIIIIIVNNYDSSNNDNNKQLLLILLSAESSRVQSKPLKMSRHC